MSNRNLIDYSSQKLYGRDSEKALLKDIFIRAKQEGPVAAFVKGPSGSGKSFLVTSALQNEVDEDTLFLSGKFDEHQPGDAFSVLVEAFAGVKNDTAQSFSNDMRRSLMENSTVLQNIFPAYLEDATSSPLSDNGSSDDEEERKGDDWGFEVMKMVLSDFMKKICRNQRIVLFLDDLQWCDKSYIDLISSFLHDPELKNFMLVGAMRIEESTTASSSDFKTEIEKCVAELETLECSITLNLENLGESACNDLISDLLCIDPETSMDLAKTVYKRTGGNAFFIKQFLQMLERSKLLYYSVVHTSWQFDLQKIHGETSLADNLVDTVVGKIRQLPLMAQQLLHIAACLGGRFDALILRDLINSLSLDDSCKGSAGDKVDEILAMCTDEALISPLSMKLEGSSFKTTDSSTFYRFTHDKVQQASYMLLDPGKQAAFHLTLGRHLKEKLGSSRSFIHLLTTTRQINRGRHLIDDADEKLQLINLNLIAAKMLRKRSAFFPASDLLDVSLGMLGENRWTCQYELCLEIFSTGAELDYCCGKHARCKERVEEILAEAKTLSDKHRAYYTYVELHDLNRKYEESLSVGYDFLKQVGIDVVKKGRLVSVVYDFMTLSRKIKKLSDMEIIKMSTTQDSSVIAKMKMLHSLLTAAAGSKRDLQYACMVIAMTKLTLKAGLTNMAPAAIAAFGAMCGIMDDFELAKRVGRLALQLDRSVGDKTYRCKTMMNHLVYIGATERAYYLNLDGLLEAHRIGMEAGDLSHSSLCAVCYVIAFNMAGLPLVSMTKDARKFSIRMVEYGQWQPLAVLQMYHQFALNLMGQGTGNASHLEGDIIKNLDQHLSIDTQGGIQRNQLYSSIHLQLSYYFREQITALNAARLNESFKDSDWPAFFALANPFFRALIWIEAARETGKRVYARKGRCCIAKMEKGAKVGMTNVHHMLLIANAEFATLSCKGSTQEIDRCRAAFDEAARVCTRSGFTQNAALTNELAGRFMFRHGDDDWGLHYMRIAAEKYQDWGADGKVAQLTEEFGRLLMKKARESVRLRGRERFDEVDQTEIRQGHGSEAWSIIQTPVP